VVMARARARKEDSAELRRFGSIDGCSGNVHICRMRAEVDPLIASEFWQKAILAAVPLLVGAIIGIFGWFHAEISEHLFGEQKRLIAAATVYSEPMTNPLDQSKDQVQEMIEFGDRLLPQLGKVQATTDVQLLAQKIKIKLSDLRHVQELLDFEIEAEKVLEGRQAAGTPDVIITEIDDMDRKYLGTPMFMRPDNSRPYLLRQKVIALRTELRKVPPSASPEVQAGVAEKIIGLGSANETPVGLLRKIETLARAVGSIDVSYPRGHAIESGFLIGDGVVLTVHYALTSIEEARRATFRIAEETQSDPNIIAEFALDPDSLYIGSSELDYSLVAVQPKSNAGALLSHYGAIDLQTIPAKISIGESLSAIYRPPGSPKVLAWRSGTVLNLQDQFLHYDYTTFGPRRRLSVGGAPLFNAAWEPIAMHHSAVPKMDSQGRILRRDGKPWDAADSQDDIDWIAREGILLSKIIADARTKLGGLSPAQRDKLMSVIGH
jgi:hypothetical protein